ncbi:MAG: ATP-binding protein [Bacteroidetes bacterium]|jgi:light-regulated signal transduction histidine kinase (bacteriophytochrome)|nr:ATP-binding protein [Bacteroidota bacterium]
MQEELEDYREGLERLVRERTAQLEEANRELEAFSYSVSHDLRAPLRHINGFVSLLQRHSSGFDKESQRYVEIISSSTSRMGRTELMKKRIDVDLLVKRVIAEISEPEDSSKIAWNLERLPEVEADSGMLRLVFVNLISNAMKYSRKRPDPEIWIAHERKDGEDVFSVKDNGVGFDMSYKGRLFGVFQRLHRQDEFEGVGIGLANVRRIIMRHGGKVWAEGEAGKGATFYFSLPSQESERKHE